MSYLTLFMIWVLWVCLVALLASTGASSEPASAYFLNWQDICPAVTELLSSCLWNREETDYQEAFTRLPNVSHPPK